jgi:hypothetical protein
MNTSVNTINTLRDLSAAITPAKSATKSVSNDTESTRFSDALEIINKQNVTYSPAKTNPPSREEVIDKKLAELRRIHEEFDYSGMDRAEAYVTIEKRFEEAFPEEFHIAMNFNSLSPEYCRILSEFGRQRPSYTGEDSMGYNQLNKYRGYEGMSYEEIEETICAKYEGKNTVRDKLNLIGELFESGVMLHNNQKNNLYVGPDFFEAISQGLITEYNLYDKTQNIPYESLDVALSSEMGLSELASLTKHVPFVTPDLFDVFNKIFDSIDERAIENKRQEYRENATKDNTPE